LPGEKKSKRSKSASSQKGSARKSAKARKSALPASPPPSEKTDGKAGASSKRKAGAKSTRAPEKEKSPVASEPLTVPAGTTPEEPSSGELKFGPNIITEIAVREVSEVEGVAELTGGWRTKGVSVLEVEGEEGVYILDVRVTVEYGVSCVALAESIRSRIVEAVERMTGQTVRTINVHVTGIRDKGHREEPHEEGVPLGEEHGIDF
jgi:uncharacterized alkaline shock family protein YloU